jgi:hypothetical protein
MSSIALVPVAEVDDRIAQAMRQPMELMKSLVHDTQSQLQFMEEKQSAMMEHLHQIEECRKADTRANNEHMERVFREERLAREAQVKNSERFYKEQLAEQRALNQKQLAEEHANNERRLKQQHEANAKLLQEERAANEAKERAFREQLQRQREASERAFDRKSAQLNALEARRNEEKANKIKVKVRHFVDSKFRKDLHAIASSLRLCGHKKSFCKAEFHKFFCVHAAVLEKKGYLDFDPDFL